MTAKASPTIRRRELGAVLRRLRADRQLSAEEVTDRLLFSPTKLSRIETGQSGASARDVRDLCDLYGVTDPSERDHLMVMAREGKQRGWWQSYDLPYATYVGLEAEAISIRTYQSGTMPGLLQTEDYARAMLSVEVPPFSPEEMQQRLVARMTRQAVLTADSLRQYHAILDQGVLRRLVGGPSVMRAQLERLSQAASQPGVAIQIIPWLAGAHPAMESNFSLLSFGSTLLSDIVYVEGLVGNHYLEKPDDIKRYSSIFEYLTTTAALSETDSRSFIENAIDQLA